MRRLAHVSKSITELQTECHSVVRLRAAAFLPLLTPSSTVVLERMNDRESKWFF